MYLRIQTGGGDHIASAQVNFESGRFVVTCNFQPELPPTPPFDVMLGRLPAGSYGVSVNCANETASTAFVVSAPILLESRIFPPGIPPPAVNYTDIWWNPSEPGWGLGIFHGPTHVIFATWFAYDSEGKAAWYTLQGGRMTSPYSFDGAIFKNRGPWFGGQFNPANVEEAQVGTGSISFYDSQRATFRYVLDGIAINKNIVRFPLE